MRLQKQDPVRSAYTYRSGEASWLLVAFNGTGWNGKNSFGKNSFDPKRQVPERDISLNASAKVRFLGGMVT